MKTELFEAFFELIYEQSLEKVNCANDVVYVVYFTGKFQFHGMLTREVTR